MQKPKILFDHQEYWDYFCGGKLYDNSNYGLLYFIIDIFREYEKNNWKQKDKNDQLFNLFHNIKNTMMVIQKNIKDIEKKYKDEFDQSFQQLNLLINSILIMIPE